MFEAMEAGKLRALYVIGENPAQSEADVAVTRKALDELDFLVVQDMFLTKTASMADVVFPAAADWCESDGTVTSSERRVQLVRKALEPPGEARTDTEILHLMARRLGFDWGMPAPEEIWDECRSLSPPHAGMSYERLGQLGGIQWPCYDEDHPGEQFLHSRLWSEDVGRRAQFTPVIHVLPADQLASDYPYRLTTGRHLDSYNTGVQSGGYSSPRRSGGALELSPDDAAQLGIDEGETVRVSSRRGSIDVPARVTDELRPGLMFMSIHFPDEVDVNVLTIDAWDQKSGTADFKATAIRVEKL
jgi:formate dehydrogenase major subunit